jgi:hypothetical protein
MRITARMFLTEIFSLVNSRVNKIKRPPLVAVMGEAIEAKIELKLSQSRPVQKSAGVIRANPKPPPLMI